MTRLIVTSLFLIALLAAQQQCCQAAGRLHAVAAQFVADTPYPQYTPGWYEGWPVEDANGRKVQYARPGMPVGGYLHAFFANRTKSAIRASDILLNGVSVTAGLGRSEDTSVDMHGASLRLSKLPRQKVSVLEEAGEPVWWKAEPHVVAPGAMGEIVVRLRRKPSVRDLRLEIQSSAGNLRLTADPGLESPRFASITFSPECDEAFLYLRHPSGRGVRPSKLFLDGVDVTASCRFAVDRSVSLTHIALDVTPSLSMMSSRLPMMSYHQFKAVYSDGTEAISGARAFGTEFVYGAWGSASRGTTPAEIAKDYLTDFRNHNINAHMGMYAGDSKPFMESDEGWDYLASIGMRQMATWQGNARNPVCYFLLDEPDAQDYNFDDLPPLQRLGMMGQPLVERMQELRDKDATTPILLNIDNTYKPDNWYTYARLADVPCADPYYTVPSGRVPMRTPEQIAFHIKPTYVAAVSEIFNRASEPKPMHIILFSTGDDTQQGRFPTPEEKRMEVYYALGEGAKGLSFWWYTPGGGGCGSAAPGAKALWREIGLLGAETRLVGAMVTRGCPIRLPATTSDPMWVRTVASGAETLLLFIVNDDVVCDRAGTAVRPVADARITVRLPSWLEAVDAFQVTSDGPADVTWQRRGDSVVIRLGELRVGAMVVVTADTDLRGVMGEQYRREFAERVQALERER